MRRTFLPLALVIFALAASAFAAPAQAKSAGPKVLRDVMAGRHTLEVMDPQQADTTVEPSLTVNPRNPLNAVAAYQAGRVDGGCAQTLGYATTLDGGKTWKHGYFPKLTIEDDGAYPLASDPVVAFGPNNVVYANHLLCNGDVNDLAVSVSTDGGKTWGAPILVPTERTLPLDDKNWIAVDNGTGPGHHPGRLYLVWDNVAPVVAMYSDDQAKTWQGPFVVWPGQGIGVLPLVMPNGDLAVVFVGAYPLPRIGSTDPDDLNPLADKFLITKALGAGSMPTGGPLVFTPSIPFATFRGTDTRGQRASEGLPTAGVDPKTGRIYVAWTDNRFRSDVTNDVVMTYSDDGLAWSDVQRVNPGRTDDYVESFTPALGVGKDGSVRIAYRRQKQAVDEIDIPDKTPFVDTYYQQSTNRGKTFSMPMKVNTKIRTDVRFAAYSRESAFLGDYSQVAVTGSWTYIVRTEAYRTSRKDKAEWPPAVHHQRTWVAVVDADGNGRP